MSLDDLFIITDGDIRNGGANDNFVADGPNGEISGKHATSSDIALVATRADNSSGEYEPLTATLIFHSLCFAFLI